MFDVYVLPTCHVYFANGVNCGYSTYLICFYMWLRVLTSRKDAIYSDRDNIIIIIGFLGLSWFCVGYVGITLVALVLRWHFVGSVGISLVVTYLICFYMWLRVLTSRKDAIYSDRDNIIIIIGKKFLGLSWFCVGYVGITLVALVLRWHFVGSVGISLVVIPSLNVDGK